MRLGVAVAIWLLACWGNPPAADADARYWVWLRDGSRSEGNRLENEGNPAQPLKLDGRPLLQTPNPARVLRDASQTSVLDAPYVEMTNGDGDLKVARMRELPEGLRRRLIGEWLKRRQVTDCGFSEVEAIDSLIPPGATVAKINLPGGQFARRNRGRIFLEDEN